MKFAGLLLSLVVGLRAESPVTYDCPPKDIELFGLNCTDEEPCPVLLELTAAEAAGGRVLVTGNLHTRNTTLFSLLLASDDTGLTWTEPTRRLRNAALEQIEFWDPQTGWISGESIDPLARNPFLLLTSDGGHTWRQKSLTEDEKFGTIAQFHFNSKTNGEMVVDAGQGNTVRQELYASMTGGESWELKEVSNKPLRLKSVRPPNQSGWRVRADSAHGAYLLERGSGRTWEMVASFSHSRRGLSLMNAIELELFRHLLTSIAEEMGIVLRKTSYSANIKERRDYSCAIYDARGETVAMGDHMPVHLGAMPLSVRAVREAFELGPGDVALVNDPFRGGTHLPDITAVAPVFTRGTKPAFYLANRAHHADVGGMSPGSMPLAREIYQEGLRIPPVLIQRAEKIDRELLGLILANVRTPAEREGDLMAQLMSIRRGETRLRELVSKYGEAVVDRNMRGLQNYSERMMRATLRGLPSGTYRFEDVLEGERPGEFFPVHVAVTLEGDTALVDFTGSSKQVDGPVNANLAVTTAATMYVFRCLVPEDIPFTSGILRPVRIVAPGGSIVNAKPPAAMAAGNVETSQRITDVILGALAKAAPERIPAASCGTMNNLSFGGGGVGREAFAYYETIAGGMGASANGDGYSATHTHMTNSWNTPVEAFEHQYPVRTESYRVRKNSGGAGAHRGGDGIVREFRFLAAAEVTVLSDRRVRGPYGLQGGGPGKTGRNTLLRGGRKLKALPAKARFEVATEDLVRIETPGGGGWGKR